MESQKPSSSAPDTVKCCDRGCSCSLACRSSQPWLRSVKRKYDEFQGGGRFYVTGTDVYLNARVQIENECDALRETVSSQQSSIQELYKELEEERNASSSAANEAMSMILRLQREKAEIQMEARQFKLFAEEKMAHDQQELLEMEDLLYKKDQAVESLNCEILAYKHRMMSYGFTEAEVEDCCNMDVTDNIDAQCDNPTFDYPPLRCLYPGGDDEGDDVDKFAFSEIPRSFRGTPRGRDNLRNLDYKLYQMEKSNSGGQLNQLDKDVSGAKNVFIVGQSPRRPRHARRFSADSVSSPLGMGKDAGSYFPVDSPRLNSSFKKMEHVAERDETNNSKNKDNASEIGDDMSDRVYTIDSYNVVVSQSGATEQKAGVNIDEDYLISTPRDKSNLPDISDPYVMKLYMRLQALEADRESMRQAIVSMRTDEAQMVLLKEIAQQLCKEISPQKRQSVRKASIFGSFSLMSMLKAAVSFVFWRNKARRSKYAYGLSPNNVGLLMLLDKGPRVKKWRCLTSTQI